MGVRLALAQLRLRCLLPGAVRIVGSTSHGMVSEGRGSRHCAETAEHRELPSTENRECLGELAVESVQLAL